jgi:Flp pilus assembly protein TadG
MKTIHKNPIVDAVQPRRGSIVVLAAFLLIVMFGMVAFAVDVGYIVHVDTELQRTADACAMAAVQRLPNHTAAVTAAQYVAQQNKGTEGPDLKVTDVVFGTWDRDTATFTPHPEDDGSGKSSANAVKVTVVRSSTRGNPLKLFFAPVIGTSKANVTASAIAMYDNNLCGPLVGIQWVAVPGGPKTDSYRSSNGSYTSQTPRDNGNLCSDGPINVDGSPVVNGDANPGRGYKTALTGSAVVTGNMSPRLRPLNLPGVDMSTVSVSNNNASLPPIQKGNNFVPILDGSRNFLLDGGRTYTIPSGTYYINDLTLTGSSKLYVDPGVKLYVTGKLDTSGGDVINATQIPSNLRIFMSGSTANISGSSDNHMVVYAPNTDVEVAGSGAFHGAVVGKTLSLTGDGGLHYDEDLKLDDALNLPKRVSLVQ